LNSENKYAYREYAFAMGFLAMSVYQFLKPDYWEVTLYFMAGTAFALMGLIKDGYFNKNKTLVDTISWALIIFTGIFFIYMLFTDT